MHKPERTSIGIPPKREELYVKLYQFIDSVIDDFEPPIQDNGKNVVAEDKITSGMSRYLNSQSRQSDDVFNFSFVNQDGPCDIGVYLGWEYDKYYKSICWIEAKRLPTPKQANRDEREYVFVDHSKLNKKGNKQYENNGGIERFKLSKHGKDYPIAIMFGYVQNETFAFWERKINEWLCIYSTTFPFDTKEQLERIGNRDNRYVSIHQRIDKNYQPVENIKIYHFWINLCTRENPDTNHIPHRRRIAAV